MMRKNMAFKQKSSLCVWRKGVESYLRNLFSTYPRNTAATHILRVIQRCLLTRIKSVERFIEKISD